MPGLKGIAVGKLSTRESLVREIQERVKAELRSQSGKQWRDSLDGPLGEQIAIAAGSWDLALAAPVDVAEGICNWLDKYFLQQSTPGNGPREETEDPLPPPCSGGGDGSRVAVSDSHCPFCGQDVPAKAVV